MAIRQTQHQTPASKIVDPRPESAYVLLAREQYERVRHLLEQEGTAMDPPQSNGNCSIPAGIRRSQEAYWRDLQGLLKLKSASQRWVAFHGDKRIGFGKTSAELYRVCLSRGLKENEIYIDRLEPRDFPPWEAEEVDAPFEARESVSEVPAIPQL